LAAIVHSQRDYRRWPLRLLAAAIWVVLLLGLQGVLNQHLNAYDVQILTLAAISVILAVSLNLINGITGQFSLGHAGFMAVGAYAAGAFSLYAGPRLVFREDVVFVLALLVAALCAGFAGLLVGLPSLRLRGDYLAIVTLGFGQIIVAIIRNIDALGAAVGMSGVPTITTFAWAWGLAALCVLTVRNLADSALGRSMQAVREDEVAAEAAGIDTTRVKVLAFVVSSMWAGVAGGLQAHLLSTVSPADYTFTESVRSVVMVVLGGLGSITGSTIVATLLCILEEKLRDLNWVFGTCAALCVLAAALSHSRHLPALRRSHKARPLQRLAAWVAWLGWPGGSLAAVAAVYFYGQDFLLRNHSQDSLRYIVYALILIVLMLLRPQGLFGRAEFGWYLLRRRTASSVPPGGPTAPGAAGAFASDQTDEANRHSAGPGPVAGSGDTR
jgi:branched-chain amino acid transport system permease protein